MIKEAIERIQSAFVGGQDDERMHVVEYLRREAAQHPGSNLEPFCMSLADTIERKAHRP